jgi:hypothetical protein
MSGSGPRHVYINMGEAGAIRGPYCGTRFRFSDIGVCPSSSPGPPASAGVRSKRGAVLGGLRDGPLGRELGVHLMIL